MGYLGRPLPFHSYEKTRLILMRKGDQGKFGMLKPIHARREEEKKEGKEEKMKRRKK